MKVVNKSVLVHSCHPLSGELSRTALEIEGRYVEKINTLGGKDLGAVPRLGQEAPPPLALLSEPQYLIMRSKCRCRRWITLWEADEYHQIGKAFQVLMLTRGALVRDESLIWMPVTRERVPRVDLISRPDIERAFIGSDKLSKHFFYNATKKRYEPVGKPAGAVQHDWLMEARAEIEFEQKFRKRFQSMIDEWHNMYMTERAKWIVDWSTVEAKWQEANGSKDDPFLGRQLLAFGPDQRTWGGH
jgi:hypothetical protein